MSRWTRDVLDPMRQVTDPEADGVIRAIFDQGAVSAVNDLLTRMFRSDDPIPAGLPPVATRYFETTGALPPWADPLKIVAGQRVFARAGWSIGGALFCASLPQAYASARGAHVLTQTQGMTRHVRQRIFETAQFLFDVLDEGALQPGGRGIRAAQKVRLMHAAIRHLLLTRPTPWDAAALGLPINQEDLAGTLTTFSIITLEAMGRLGEHIPAGDAEAWVHTWNVAGALLGILPALLPRDVADGQALRTAIQERQWAPSEDGHALAMPLVEMMQSYLPLPARGLPVAMIAHLSGNRCTQILGLRPSRVWQLMIDSSVMALGPFERSTGAELQRRFFAPFTHGLMNALVLAEREGKQARFRIPPSLRRSVQSRF